MILTIAMAHPRELIRQAVVALLVAANTAAGARVYGTRIDPHKKTGVPALSVYTLNDPADPEASSEMEEAHDIALEIEAWADPSAIDGLVEQVEAAMRADPYFGGLASDSTLTGTSLGIEQGDPALALGVLTYSVKYHVALEAT